MVFIQIIGKAIASLSLIINTYNPKLKLLQSKDVIAEYDIILQDLKEKTKCYSKAKTYDEKVIKVTHILKLNNELTILI